MNRLARVVARSNHAVILELIKADKCAGCPANCNEPLIDLFSLRKNLFRLSKKNEQYELIDESNLLRMPEVLDRIIKISIDQKDLLKSSAMFYLVPLLLALFVITVGHFVGLGLSLPTDITAGIGLILAMIIVSYLISTKNLHKLLSFRPKVMIL